MANDITESPRRERIAEINAGPSERETLEAQYGEVYGTDQMREAFDALGFMYPYIVVRRKSDGIKGSLEFRHNPRFYFNFQKA